MCACQVASIVSNSLRPHGLYSSPGSSVHGILQVRILELPCASPGESSRTKDQTPVSWGSCIVGGFFTAESLGKPHFTVYNLLFLFVCDGREVYVICYISVSVKSCSFELVV